MGKTFDKNRLGQVGEFLRDNINKDSKVDVVSSIFTIYAFDKLKKQLNQTESVRFLYNEPTFLDNSFIVNKDSKVFVLEMKNRERNMSEFDLEIALKNKLDQPTVAQEFYNFINNKVNVKSVINKNVINHKFIQVKNTNEKNYLLDGSNLDFSLEGLGYKNRVMFDFKKYEDDPGIINDFSNFFDEIWNNQDVTKDVKANMLEHLTTLYKENAPELIYYLTLYHMFKDILINQDDYTRIKEKTGIHNSKIWNMLYNFQQDAAVGAIKKIETYNGCIIADSVGLGKTFEALAIIKYYELRNDRVLVLSPKKLRSNWTSFKQNSTSNMLAEDRFNYDVLNHTDLSRDGGYSGDIDLSTINWGNYDLLVIDESHNFRNAPAVKDRITRYDKLMDWIIKSGVKTKVLMLSATPVNNRLADLKNQIRFITEDNDHALAESTNIESVERTLTNAQRRFNEWGERPDGLRSTDALLQMLDYDFFNLLNSLTIARSRKHIQKYYDTKDIGEFPKRLTPITIKSDIDALGEFPSLSSVNGDIAKLTLPIYSPMLYLLPTRVAEYEEKYGQTVKGGTSSFTQTDRERSLVNLMRVNILKRLESSVDAFRLTIGRVLTQIDDALQKIENHKSFDYDSINDADDEWEDVEVGKKITVLLKDMDRIRYKNDLLEDKAILQRLLDESYKVTVDRDKKLLDLKEQITNKIKNPINPNNKKMIIFTSFSDTAEYLYKNISDWVKDNFGVNSGLVTGSSALKNNAPNVRNHFEDILIHFSPESSKYISKEGSIDILIATDCISEGQNLQDCDYLVNYDIHWNPVRIIQRFGRIDRIGSKNKVIQLVNFWPNMELDEYINLESRVKNRMALLDLSATGEDDVLSAEGKDLAYRKEQLKKLQEEVVDLEDISGGISITDFTLDDFIISLEKYMKEHPSMLEDYPTGIHAVTNIPNQVKDEAVEGVIYCLKQMNYDVNEKAANSLYPFFLVYVKQDGDIHISNKSPKRILDLFKSMTTGKSDVLREVVESFNKETKDGTKMDKYTELLEKAVFDIKGIAEEKGVQSLFRLGRSTIKTNQVKGLNDFELVSFLVIKDE
ncbi:MAG: helicase [Candidatus Izimaplasma sp.]|nr:helicase [Candidatus Izimaplasma bacterium]